MRGEKTAAGCGTFGYYLKNILKFLLSHIGLVSLVVGYTIIGAVTFERLEAEEEVNVKLNVTATRKKVTDDLWEITDNSLYFKEHLWAEKVRERLEEFEMDLIKAMKNNGWDGNEDIHTKQWTFAGALFYSIILITTIGYGHIAPKTTWGKVVTIFYAIPGVPLMMLCLANIGDGMAQSFRFLYWKVCCYACTKKPKRKRRPRPVRVSTRRMQDDHMDPTMDPRVVKARGRMGEEPGRGSTRSRGGPDGPSNLRTSQHSTRSGDHLEIPNHDEEEGRSSVLYNKYALDKDGIPTHDELPGVHNSSTHGPDIMPDYRLDQRGEPEFEQERDRHRDRDPTRFREPEILVTRAPRSAPGSLRGPPRPAYPDSPSTSQRDSGFYSRHLPPSDPRHRLSRLDEEYFYDDYYDDDEEEEEEQDENVDKPVPIWLGVMLVVAYIFGGAFLFSGWEGWNFLDSVYFCFITLTTIGFGDFVPAQEKKENAELSIALCSIYLLFGIALLAMSFNLVQEEVISNVKRVAKRLGIIKEEGEDEEENI